MAAAPQDHDDALLKAGGSAASIVRNKQRIFEEFKVGVRARLSAARRESMPMIIDTLPAFLTRLALALLPDAELSFASEYSNIAMQHGIERARFTQYSLSDVIHEYRILREILVEVLREEDGPNPYEWKIVHRSIDEAIAEAASAFVKTHDSFREVFTAALSHDFRGPLANASNYLELMRRNADPPRQAQFAARAQQNLEQLSRMISELLDVTQANAGGGLTVRAEACDAVQLARDVIEDLRELHGDRYVLHSPEHVHGYWDCERIKQVLHNLLENAFKYGRDDTPISVSLDSSEGRLRMSCHNEGNPIPPEIIPDLFLPFRRSAAAVDGHRPGWGLGLMLVQAIAIAHGGAVNVESSPHAGTTFTFDVLSDARQLDGNLPAPKQARA